MKSVLSIFVFCAFSAFGQFVPIWTVPNYYSSFDVRSFEMNASGQGLLIVDPYNGGPTTNLKAYSTQDFGSTWDSTLFVNFAMMKDNSFVTDGGKMYFSSIQNVFPTSSTPGYQRRVVHASLDGGATWAEKTVDSLNGPNKENALAFINDSTGMFMYHKGRYVTTDYGDSWTKVDTLPAEVVGVLDDRFILYSFQNAWTYDPINSIGEAFDYLPFCEGQVRHTAFRNSTAYRGIRAQNGYVLGPDYWFNFASLNIDELPLGIQRYIHFPRRFALVDLEVTENCIHLILDGVHVRSCDDASSFYDIYGFSSPPAEQVHYLDFLSDSLGFAVTRDVNTGEWKLWKTTNGGGANSTVVLTNAFEETLSLNELPNPSKITLFPNPAQTKFVLKADENLEEILIYSMMGRLVKRIAANNSQELEIDIEDLSPGQYNVRAITQSGVVMTKLLKL